MYLNRATSQKLVVGEEQGCCSLDNSFFVSFLSRESTVSAATLKSGKQVRLYTRGHATLMQLKQHGNNTLSRLTQTEDKLCRFERGRGGGWEPFEIRRSRKPPARICRIFSKWRVRIFMVLRDGFDYWTSKERDTRSMETWIE